jgi:hypothetical protein
MQWHNITSVHWTDTGHISGKNIAVEIEKRLEDFDALKQYMNQWTAFSDLTYASTGCWLEGNKNFRIFYELFPRSFFILNDRNTEAWIQSRIAHDDGALLRLATTCFDTSRLDVLNDWRVCKERHTESVLDFFSGQNRFLHFRIDEDPPGKLTEFLSPVFLIRSKKWPHHHKTSARAFQEQGITETGIENDPISGGGCDSV